MPIPFKVADKALMFLRKNDMKEAEHRKDERELGHLKEGVHLLDVMFQSYHKIVDVTRKRMFTCLK